MKDDEFKKTLINYIKNQDVEEIKKFIKKNKHKNFEFTDNKGKTILHFVVEQKNEKTLPILQELLKLDLDINAIDENFETAIEVAQRLNNIPAVAILKHKLNLINKKL
jgi:ankyrin repeat protein